MVVFVIGTCASVAVARTAMGKVSVWPQVIAAMGFAPPLHLVLHDASGDAAVVEWRDGAMVVYDNPIGVTTNSPHFDWHLVNLRNYGTLTPTNPPDREISGMSLAPLGQGVGLRGLPGDISPPSRFIRGAAFTASHVPFADGAAGEHAMLHVMNNFDIPFGSVRSADGSSVEQTRWRVVANLADGHYIIRSWGDPTPRLIDLSSVDFAHDPRQVDLPRQGWASLAV